MARGYVYDVETGLYYLQSRYYDPEIGRFINVDDPKYLGVDGTLQSYNLFAYCSNNPINSSDETGNSPIISGLIGAVTSVASSYISGERGLDLLDSTIRGFLGGAIPLVGIVLSIDDAVTLGIAVAQRTGNDFYGVVAACLNLGVSCFTGDNISKLKGVVGMDEAAKLLFDAVFGFMANVFHAQAINELFPESSEISTTSNHLGSNSSLKPIISRNIHCVAIY